MLIYLDANHDPNFKWIDTLTGKPMVAAGTGGIIDIKHRWSHTEKP